MTFSPSVAVKEEVGSVAPRVYSCRFYVVGVAVRVLFSPEANVANIHETLPRPDGLEIILPCLEPGDGAFQVQLRPLENLRERAEVVDDRGTQKPA